MNRAFDFFLLGLFAMFSFGGMAFGCGGGDEPAPNRFLGVYASYGVFGESDSDTFLDLWFDGDEHSASEAIALSNAVGTTEHTAIFTVIPGEVLYEETIVEVVSGRTLTISIPGAWSSLDADSIIVNWGSAYVTHSTFPDVVPFHIAQEGELLEGPHAGDIVDFIEGFSFAVDGRPFPFFVDLERVNQ